MSPAEMKEAYQNSKLGQAAVELLSQPPERTEQGAGHRGREVHRLCQGRFQMFRHPAPPMLTGACALSPLPPHAEMAIVWDGVPALVSCAFVLGL